MAEERPGVLQPLTAEALADGHKILASARHGALATVGPDGHPMVSRVAVASLDGGRTPLMLVSSLAAHTPQLRADPRCSLLVGDIEKGDPLASPRLTLICRAADVPRTDALRVSWLAAHPKAKLYVDLPDFTFMALTVERVTFVGGFGRAYAIPGETWMAD